MRNLIILIGIFMTGVMQGQMSGKITYVETRAMNVEIEGDEISGIDLSSIMPSEHKNVMLLMFADQRSSYMKGEKQEYEDQTIATEDGSIQIEIMEDDTESNYFVDYKTRKVLDQQGFMGKNFIIESILEKAQWKISPEKVKYLDYECLKATTKNEKGLEITAWFAPQIPVGVGPSGYGQLPGAILMLTTEDKSVEIKATDIQLNEDVSVQMPTEGKRVTEEEYKQIVDDKMKEMEESMKGRGMMIQVRG